MPVIGVAREKWDDDALRARARESIEKYEGGVDRQAFDKLGGLMRKDRARDFFTRLTGLYKDFNYSPADSEEYRRYQQEIDDLAEKHAGLQ